MELVAQDVLAGGLLRRVKRKAWQLQGEPLVRCGAIQPGGGQPIARPDQLGCDRLEQQQSAPRLLKHLLDLQALAKVLDGARAIVAVHGYLSEGKVRQLDA